LVKAVLALAVETADLLFIRLLKQDFMSNEYIEQHSEPGFLRFPVPSE
jgi:hypothetical protein